MKINTSLGDTSLYSSKIADMVSIIIIDDLLPDVADGSASSKCEIVRILSFHYDSERVNNWAREIQKKHGLQTQVIQAGKRFHQLAPKVKDDFSELVAKVPGRYMRRGKNLKEALAVEGKLSLWWLCEISMKNSESKPTFNRLCQLYVILELIEEGPCSAIDLFTTDPVFSEVLRRAATSRQLQFHSTAGPLPSPYRKTLRSFAGRAKWFIQVTVFTLWARRLLPRLDVKRIQENRSVAFLTFYPNLWRSKDFVKDEKYGNLPKTLNEMLNGRVCYAYTLVSDGFYQRVGLRDFITHCRRLRAGQTPDGLCLYSLDRELTFGDILKAFWGKTALWDLLRLEWDAQFKALWTLWGVDVYPLVREEMRMTFRRIPGYLAEAFRVRRFVEQYKVNCLITYLFEFCYGRAIIYGAKTAKPYPVVIAMQHGPTASLKLVYYHYPGEIRPCPERPSDMIHNMPQADLLLVEGRLAQEMLGRSGFDRNRIKVVGAPRLDDSMLMRSESNGRNGAIRPRLLFALGLHDYQQMLAFSRPLLQKQSSYQVVFRPHPKTRQIVKRLLDQIASENGEDRCELDDGDVRASIDRADIVIATYSSVGVEALVAGKPVICVNLPNAVNISPLVDMPGPARFVYDTQGLSAAIESILDQRSRSVDDIVAEVERMNFNVLDGRANLRAAEAISSRCSPA